MRVSSSKVSRRILSDWADESDFPLQIPRNSQNDRVFFKEQKKDVPDKNLIKQIGSVLK